MLHPPLSYRIGHMTTSKNDADMRGNVPKQTHPLDLNTEDLLQSLGEAFEVVSTSGLFDDEWYLRKYIDVAMLGMAPIEHYLLVGDVSGGSRLLNSTRQLTLRPTWMLLKRASTRLCITSSSAGRRDAGYRAPA